MKVTKAITRFEAEMQIRLFLQDQDQDLQTVSDNLAKEPKTVTNNAPVQSKVVKSTTAKVKSIN